MKCSTVSQAATYIVILLAVMLISATSALAGKLPATGQTTAYPARNNGDQAPVAVPDDGTLQRRATLHYTVLPDGTVKDLNTGLIWEVKCDRLVGCLPQHNVHNTYPWSGDGAEDTIWDWLDQINTEGGTGYAGHNDWRVPNVRELQSIVDYGVFNPTIDPIFGPTATSRYWSSTTFALDPSAAWMCISSAEA
jgi:uncharacterized protein DUF1566